MAITFDIITLLSLGFSKFSCGDYVISKMADIGTGKLWEEIKKRIPKNEESLESQLYDAIEASLKQYADLGYNSDQVAAACEIIFGMWIKEGHLSEEYVKKALGYLNPNPIAGRNVKVWYRQFYGEIVERAALRDWYMLQMMGSLQEQITARDENITKQIIRYMEQQQNQKKSERNTENQQKKLQQEKTQEKIRKQIFQSILKEDITLQQIYISMHGKLKECNMPGGRLNGCSQIVDTTEYIWKWYEQEMPPLLMLHGEPGSGKSSLVKIVAATMTAREKTDGLVAFVELHRLLFVETESALETVRNYIKKEYPYFLDTACKGKRLLILDGLDEIKYKVYEKSQELVRELEMYDWSVSCACIVSGRTQIIQQVQAVEEIQCEELEIMPLFPDEYVIINEGKEVYDPHNLQEEDLRELYWGKLMKAFEIDYQMPLGNSRFEELSKSPLLMFLVVWTIRHTDCRFEDFKNTAELYDAIFKHIYTREYNRVSEREIYFKSKEYLEYQQMLHDLGGCAYKYNSRSVGIGQIYEYCKSMGHEELCRRWIQIHREDNPSKLVLLFFLREELDEMDWQQSEIEFIHKTFYEYLAAISIIEALYRSVKEPDDADMMQKLFYVLSDNVLNVEILRFMGEIIENENLYVDQKKITQKQFSKIFEDVIMRGFRKDYPFFNGRQGEKARIEVHSYRECMDKVRIYEDNLKDIQAKFINEYTKMDLSCVDLSEADLREWQFDNVRLENSCLENSILSHVSFQNCFMADASLSMVTADKADFRNADLHGTDFSGAHLATADFTRAELEDANFELADLEGAYFCKTVLNGTRFGASDLTASNFDGVMVLSADFNQADLSRADFTGAKIISANWEGCLMDGTKLDNVKLMQFDLEDNDIIEMLAEADLTYADWTGVSEAIRRELLVRKR